MAELPELQLGDRASIYICRFGNSLPWNTSHKSEPFKGLPEASMNRRTYEEFRHDRLEELINANPK